MAADFSRWTWRIPLIKPSKSKPRIIWTYAYHISICIHSNTVCMLIFYIGWAPPPGGGKTGAGQSRPTLRGGVSTKPKETCAQKLACELNAAMDSALPNSQSRGSRAKKKNPRSPSQGSARTQQYVWTIESTHIKSHSLQIGESQVGGWQSPVVPAAWPCAGNVVVPQLSDTEKCRRLKHKSEYRSEGIFPGQWDGGLGSSAARYWYHRSNHAQAVKVHRHIFPHPVCHSLQFSMNHFIVWIL